MLRPWVERAVKKAYNAAKTHHGAFAKNMLGLELADQLSRVVPSVLGNDRGQLSEEQKSQLHQMTMRDEFRVFKVKPQQMEMRDHLRAFAKLDMALASLPGVTLANSSTALFGSRI